MEEKPDPNRKHTWNSKIFFPWLNCERLKVILLGIVSFVIVTMFILGIQKGIGIGRYQFLFDGSVLVKIDTYTGKISFFRYGEWLEYTAVVEKIREEKVERERREVEQERQKSEEIIESYLQAKGLGSLRDLHEATIAGLKALQKQHKLTPDRAEELVKLESYLKRKDLTDEQRAGLELLAEYGELTPELAERMIKSESEEGIEKVKKEAEE